MPSATIASAPEMATVATVSVKVPEPIPTAPTEEVSKYSIRKQIWTLFDKLNLALFPRPVRGRIPNFRGAPDASEKLASLPIFQEAEVVKVSVDKPQEGVRQRVLQAKKRLLESPRRGTDALLLEVTLPENAPTHLARSAATRVGMEQYAKPIAMETPLKIDLYVLGSVAVSRTGQRIGKCDNFTDLEFGVLTELGMVTKDTVIVTTVHDQQVFDTLPDDLFREHDIPVDWIITPTQVIEVPKLNDTRPSGILWHLLSERRLKLSKIVTAIRDKQIAEGKECHLKTPDTDDETENTRRMNHQPIRRFFRNHPRSNSNHRRRWNRNPSAGNNSSRPVTASMNPGDPNLKLNEQNKGEGMNKEERGGPRRGKEGRPARRRMWRPPVLFTLRIGNITSAVRVRDLKKALAERNVKPSDITWRGRRGFALVHFAKPRKPTMEPNVLLDTVVASLKDMKLGGSDSGENKSVLVEPASSPKKVQVAEQVQQPVAVQNAN